MLSKYIEPFPFFIAIFFGLMMCYVMTPTPKIVFKHPTPENVDDVIYQDGSDNCYKYQVDEVKCPTDANKIKEHPVNI